MSREIASREGTSEGLEVVFRFANHNCRFDELDGLRSLMQAANETNVTRYVETPLTPAAPTPPAHGDSSRLELGRTNPTKYDYNYQTPADENLETTSDTEKKAVTSPLTVTQTDLSSLDNCKQLPQDAPPRDIHSSDSHVRRVVQGSRGNGRSTPTIHRNTDQVKDSSMVAVGALSSLQERPGSTPYAYKPRSNGAALQTVFHFSMSYVSSRTWMNRYPDSEPTASLMGLKLLHGAVQGIKKEIPFSYGKVAKGKWRVEPRNVMRAMPKPAAPLPPIAAPPLHPMPAFGESTTRRKRLNTAQRIKRHTQKLQEELQEIERQVHERVAQNMASYASTQPGTKNHKLNSTMTSTMKRGSKFNPNDTAKSTDLGGTQKSVTHDEKNGTTTSLPSIYNKQHQQPSGGAKRDTKEFNRTTGGGQAGFIRGTSRAAAIIDNIVGKSMSPREHTPRTPGGSPGTFVRSVQHRGLFGAQAGQKTNLVNTV